jgi:ABC-2 type transport system permease protein
MKHIWTLIAYDLRSQLRERGTLVLLAVALLLALFGLYEGRRFEQQSRSAVEAADAQQVQARATANALAQRYFAQPDAPEFAVLQWWRTPLDIRGYAFREHVGFAAKPEIPGAALAVGQADLLPSYVRVRAESMESARTALEIEHPALLAVGRFDLMFFVVYLWPLILLSLTTSVLTQDRESLRLRALQLQGVRLGRMLDAQVTARVLAATALLLLACGSAALLSGAIPATSAGLAALAQWSGVVLLYSLFWAAVAIAVCAACGNRMTAAFAGFGAWLVLAILIPGALTAAVQAGAPVPQRERYVQALRDAGDQVAANKLTSLARFYDAHPGWKPAGTLDQVSSSVSRLQRAQELERVMAGVDRQFQQASEHRQQLFDSLQGLSPVTLAYQSLSALAGNDGARHQRFLAEVQRHQQALRDYFQQMIQLSALGDQRAPCPKTCLGGYGFRDFDQVPAFTPSPALGGVTSWSGPLALLPLWIAALLGLAAIILARRRVN